MKKKLLYAFIAITSSFHVSNAQWTSANGPSAALVQSFATIGDTVLAGTTDGIFLSTNSGDSWAKSLTGFTHKGVAGLLVNDKKIYAVSERGSGVGGIFVSYNYGNSWTALNTNFTKSATSIAIDGSHIFVGTNGQGVQTSLNSGTTFTATNTGLGNTKVFSLVVKGGLVFAGTEAGVFVSADNAANWTSSSTGIAANATIKSLVVSGNTILAGTTGYLYASTDNGANWTRVGNNITGGVNTMLVSGNKVYTAGSGPVYMSTDNSTFTQISTSGLPPAANSVINAIALNKNALFTAHSGSGVNATAGVYKSMDGGSKWTLSNAGLYFKVNTIFSQGTSLFVGTDGGAFVSTNSGTSFAEINTGLYRRDIRALGFNGTYLVAGAGSGTFFSNNSGSTWTQMSKTASPSAGMAFTGNAMYAAEQSAVKKSVDNGVTNWTSGTGLPATLYVSIAASGNIAFVGSQNSGVYRSLNGGATWTAANSGISGSGIFALATDGLTSYAGPSGGGIFLSIDSGATWKAASTGLAPGTSVYSICMSGDNVFVGTLAGEIYYSNNKGTSWTNISTGLTGTTIYSLATDGVNLYAGSAGAGLFKRSLSEIFTAVNVPFMALGLSATSVSESEIKLTWYDYAPNEDKFIVEQSTSIAGPWTVAGEVITNGIEGFNTNTLSVTGLTPETIYLFRVLTNNTVGNAASTLPVAAAGKSVVTGLQTSTISEDLFEVFPNPNSTGQLHIAMHPSTSGTLVLYDLLGNRILQKAFNVNERDLLLDVQQLPKGMYLLKDAETLWFKKVTLQ